MEKRDEEKDGHIEKNRQTCKYRERNREREGDKTVTNALKIDNDLNIMKRISAISHRDCSNFTTISMP